VKLSLQPRVLLRKLGATVFSAPARLGSLELVRSLGTIVAVRTHAGWQTSDEEGRLTPAAPGMAKLYDSLDEWRP
jgi:hypothetical protein